MNIFTSKSLKQKSLEKQLLKRLDGKARQIAELLINDIEVQTLQDYANVVSIKRLGYNDHGPVHMLKAALNSMTMFDLLKQADVKLNLETEGLGSVEDSKVVVLTATLLHDIGMSVSREKHELMSITLALPIINRLLPPLYEDNQQLFYIVRSMIIEGIFGHMATQTIHSLEAGLVLIGDGCDMEKGRARIPQMISDKPQVGDIHKYSSTAIQKVSFLKGKEKPIRIKIEMDQTVGFFQVEEVLYPKITISPIKPYIELYAGIKGEKPLRYL